MTSLNVSNNDIRAEGTKTFAEAFKNNQTMTKLDISSNNIGNWGEMSGVTAISDAIPTMGALVTTNILGNRIGKDQLSKLQEIMKAHPTLVSLCGIADNTTEANLSGLGMDADDAAVLADELPAKGALTSLNMSDNQLIGGYQDDDGEWISDMTGIEALAAAIPTCK